MPIYIKIVCQNVKPACVYVNATATLPDRTNATYPEPDS